MNDFRHPSIEEMDRLMRQARLQNSVMLAAVLKDLFRKLVGVAVPGGRAAGPARSRYAH